MRRLLRWSSRGLLLVLLGVLAEIAFFVASGMALPPPGAPPAIPTQVQGAYHVHSTLSDGRSSPEEVAGAAARAGLQFVVLTDHNLEVLPAPRFVHGVLLIFATELTTPWGHAVALDLARGLTREERSGDLPGAVHRQGGALFLAHPVQARNPWRGWHEITGVDGLELYSGDTLFREALRRPLRRLLPALGTYLARPAWGLWSLAEESAETRERVLQLSQTRRVSALCALDAHGWPSYDAAFRALSLYLELGQPLSTEPAQAAKQVTGALRRGAFHCGFGDWASADGFRLQGELDTERNAPVGSTLDVVLPPVPPGRIEVRVFGGGRLNPRSTRIVLERPGPVWVEVWVEPEGGEPARGWRPWIVASPVQVVGRAAGP